MFLFHIRQLYKRYNYIYIYAQISQNLFLFSRVMLYKLRRCTVDINKSVCKNYLEITKIDRVRKKRMERKKGKKLPVRNQPAIVHQSPQAVFLENLNLIPQPSPPPPSLPQGGETVVQDSPPPSNNYDTNLDTVKKNVCGHNPVGWRTQQENRLAAHHHHHHHYRREERLSCKIHHHHHHHPTTTTTTMSGGQYFD